ncbi:MAG: hydrogenase maturation protease [Chloroflexi bacterium]|nr:hydrogenase maturation protease [Chloroflexota bacterium]
MKKILLLGYGNPDREDDGVAWHILRELTARMGLSAPDSYEDDFPEDPQVDFAFHLQLTPEMAEEIAQYEYVCFVDAHTGDIPEEVRLIEVESDFQRSPLTHHLTPQSLMSICEAIYKRKPKAMLLSTRGYKFQFTRALSAQTALLIPQAAEMILNRLNIENMPINVMS